MTNRTITSRMIGFGTVGILGFLTMVAMAAEEAQFARETFVETAERFGIFAAFTIGFTVLSTGGLIWLIHYVIVTLQQVVDDNTTAMLKLNQMLRTRPCLHDSDIDDIEPDSNPDGIVSRVLERRRKRESKP
jgi:hypothetical protein